MATFKIEIQNKRATYNLRIYNVVFFRLSSTGDEKKILQL
jgi:hypothetical protein